MLKYFLPYSSPRRLPRFVGPGYQAASLQYTSGNAHTSCSYPSGSRVFASSWSSLWYFPCLFHLLAAPNWVLLIQPTIEVLKSMWQSQREQIRRLLALMFSAWRWTVTQMAASKTLEFWRYSFFSFDSITKICNQNVLRDNEKYLVRYSYQKHRLDRSVNESLKKFNVL